MLSQNFQSGASQSRQKWIASHWNYFTATLVGANNVFCPFLPQVCLTKLSTRRFEKHIKAMWVIFVFTPASEWVTIQAERNNWSFSQCCLLYPTSVPNKDCPVLYQQVWRSSEWIHPFESRKWTLFSYYLLKNRPQREQKANRWILDICCCFHLNSTLHWPFIVQPL